MAGAGGGLRSALNPAKAPNLFPEKPETLKAKIVAFGGTMCRCSMVRANAAILSLGRL